MRSGLFVSVVIACGAVPASGFADDLKNAYRVVDAIIVADKGRIPPVYEHDVHDYTVRCVLKNAPRRRLNQLADAEVGAVRFGLLNYVRQVLKRRPVNDCVMRNVMGLE